MTSPLSTPSNLQLGDILYSYSAHLPKEVLINAVLELKLNSVLSWVWHYRDGQDGGFSCVTAAAGVFSLAVFLKCDTAGALQT